MSNPYTTGSKEFAAWDLINGTRWASKPREFKDAYTNALCGFAVATADMSDADAAQARHGACEGLMASASEN